MSNLKLINITKQFPGIKALDNVSLDIFPHEVHALCGENGAGKSTLMNVLVGNHPLESGRMELNGKPYSPASPREAASQGISIVYQHLSLVENLSVAENIMIPSVSKTRQRFIDFDEWNNVVQLFLDSLGLDQISPRSRVGKLSPAQKQMVEIAKALHQNPQVLILDEPTASLSESETKHLFRVLHQLREQGKAIVYISHRLEEVFHLSDRISVLKDGKHQGTFPTLEMTREKLISKMVGREIPQLSKVISPRPHVLLDVKQLSGKRFKNISFQIFKGEIVGLAGLVGAGRTEIGRAIFGLDAYSKGELIFKEKLLENHTAAKAISDGMAYLSEDRKNLGLFPEMNIADNMMVTHEHRVDVKNRYDRKLSYAVADEMSAQFQIKARSVHQSVNALSGGNQQKVLIARCLITNPDLLIVDEPTVGVDVRAKFEIYKILQALAQEGKGILMISSDLPELLSVSHRIIVIRRGAIAGILTHHEATEERIMSLTAE
jgi:ABC-type sugar transport system ATPase subunit